MKITVSIFLFLFGLTISNAQMKFGVEAGAQITTLRFDDSQTETNSIIGYYLGGFANYRISEDFAFQPELLYSLQGTEFLYGATHNPYVEEGKIILHYINLPLMLKWYMYKGLNIEFGPQFGFMVDGKQKGTIWSYDYETDTEFTHPFEYEIKNKADFGVNLGLGYEMNIGINIDVRYHLGSQNTGGRVSGKNSVFSFGAGYRF